MVEGIIPGNWYNLDPPAQINGKQFTLARCEFNVPEDPAGSDIDSGPDPKSGTNSYCFRGIPVGGTTAEDFLIDIEPGAIVKVTPVEGPASA